MKCLGCVSYLTESVNISVKNSCRHVCYVKPLQLLSSLMSTCLFITYIRSRWGQYEFIQPQQRSNQIIHETFMINAALTRRSRCVAAVITSALMQLFETHSSGNVKKFCLSLINWDVNSHRCLFNTELGHLNLMFYTKNDFHDESYYLFKHVLMELTSIYRPENTAWSLNTVN